jgi:cytochrome c-type biogenesis protein CcmH
MTAMERGRLSCDESNAGLARWLVFGAGAFLVGLCFFMLSAAVLHAASIEEEAQAIAKMLKCPVCQNIPVAYSQSQLAAEMREVISEKLAQGESREQIIQYFVERYGEDVLLEPPRRGFGLLVWVAPVLVLAVGLLIVSIILGNWARRSRVAAARAEAPPPTAPAADTADLEQIFAEEFQRYKRGKLL